jgi:ribonucleoside-diphosphate reductase alpha chain
MTACGIPSEPDVMNKSNTVFYFPVKSPLGSVTRNDLTATDTLEMWKDLQEHWCEHKPSVTVNVKEEEWMKVGAWVYDNFDIVSGVSFLPFDGGSYRQAPYQELTEDQYLEWVTKMPTEIDWTMLQHFEKEDTTTGSQDLACSSGVCEVVDLTKGD